MARLWWGYGVVMDISFVKQNSETDPLNNPAEPLYNPGYNILTGL